ncbi:MAG: hypothetical protein QXP52_01715 [Candidatus Aenigmatarchaeota archaeon]
MPVKRAVKRASEQLEIGEVAFLAGILIAVISGILIAIDVIKVQEIVVWTLFGLGILVGLLNIRKEEYTTFLLASLIFLVPLGVAAEVPGAELIFKIVKLIGIFVLPAALITAFKAIWDTAAKK